MRTGCLTVTAPRSGRRYGVVCDRLDGGWARITVAQFATFETAVKMGYRQLKPSRSLLVVELDASNAVTAVLHPDGRPTGLDQALFVGMWPAREVG